MTDESTSEAPEQAEASQEEVSESVETPVVEDNQEEVQEEAQAEETDLVEQALLKEKELKEKLEALEIDSDNVFERNAALEKKLEDAQKLADLEAKNKEMESRLEGIKRKSITDSLKLNDKMKDLVGRMSFEDLQIYAENAPKQRTILDEKNPGSGESDLVKKFNKEQNKGRILP